MISASATGGCAMARWPSMQCIAMGEFYGGILSYSERNGAHGGEQKSDDVHNSFNNNNYNIEDKQCLINKR